MKKIYVALLLMGISSLQAMKYKKILNKTNKNSVMGYSITSKKTNKSFFRELKEQHKFLFLDIQKNIIDGFNVNKSPKDILWQIGTYLAEKNQNFKVGNIPISIFSKKILLYTMGAHQPLSYILEEMKKFGPNATILAGVCAESNDSSAKFQRIMIQVIFYYQERGTDAKEIKKELIDFLEKSEALTIAHEQNNVILQGIIENYLMLLKEKPAEEALQDIIKSYYQTCAAIIEWK